MRPLAPTLGGLGEIPDVNRQSCAQASRATYRPQATGAHGYQLSLTSTPPRQASRNATPGRPIPAPPTFQAGARPPRCTMISAESAESRPSRCAVASRARTQRTRPRGGQLRERRASAAHAANSAAKCLDPDGHRSTVLHPTASESGALPDLLHQHVNDRSAAAPVGQARVRRPGHSQTRDRAYPGVQHALLA
jgi:hypothetical protein